MRLDDYYTVKALRKQIALADKGLGFDKKPPHKLNEELTETLCKEVDELCKTLKLFGLLSEEGINMRRRVEIMKRIREDLGDVFLYSLRVANSLDLDVSRSVHEKIYPILKNGESPWKD